MRFEINISEQELKEVMIEKLATRLLDGVTGWGSDAAEERKKILSKIDWKKSAPFVTEAVIKKFFEDLAGRK